MTTRFQAAQTINTAFLAAWTISPGVLQTVVATENTDLPADDEWTAIGIADEGAKQRSLGQQNSRDVENSAAVIIDIHVARGKDGSQRADALAMIAIAPFELKRLTGGLIFFAASIFHVGEWKSWYKVAIRIPFTYDRRI
jgi:hypothetical protein